MLTRTHPTPSHEDEFVRRYDTLLRRALQVTAHDREDAEDLVQEAFVRFTLVRPPLDEIDNLDAYLGAMLRNMHTSRLRRAGRAPGTHVSFLDYDSAEWGLRAIDPRPRLHARHELRALCEFACARKDASKSGSVLILRFFHGYVPSEIARLLRTTPWVVDKWLRLARREARHELERPAPGPRLAETPKPRRLPRAMTPILSDDDATSEAMQAELRDTIFRGRHVRCFSRAEIESLYPASPDLPPIENATLAQIVCCPDCLDAANARLGLARLAERFPTDTLGPSSRSSGPRGDGGPGLGGSGGGGRGGRRLTDSRHVRRRAVQRFEHRPQELRVIVNGFLCGAQRIGPDVNELSLRASADEPIGLIELFSEQDVCLAYLTVVPPPQGQVEQSLSIALSDERTLDVTLTFVEPWPMIYVTYHDPHCGDLEPSPIDQEEARTPAGVTGSPANAAAPARTRTSRWLDALRSFSRGRFLPPRRALVTATLIALVAWLLFATPFTTVSAAEWIGRTVRRVASEWLGWPPRAASAPPFIDARPLPPMAARVTGPAARRVTPRPVGAPHAPRAETVARLELEALVRLQGAHAYLGQEVQFLRRAGAPRLDAIVDTAARREALLAALGSRASPTLPVHIVTLTEAAARRRRSSTAPARWREVRFANDRLPVYDALAGYFSASGGATDGASVEARVQAFAADMLAHSRRAGQHVWALQRLAERYSPATVDALDPPGHAAWLALTHGHARALRAELSALRARLAPIFRRRDEMDTHAGPEPEGRAEPVWSLVPRLFARYAALDATIEATFAVSSNNQQASALSSPQFWHLLDETLAVALALEP